MSTRRLLGTAAVMALIAGALALLTPGIAAMAGTLAAAQRTADTAGPDVLVLSAAGLLAWAVWAWGALGLTLTAASALPGLLGGAARVALHVVLPAGARRSAALALGLGLGVAGPLLGTAALMAPAPAAAADTWTPPSTAGVPDWPAAPATQPAPDWPAGEASQSPAPQSPAPQSPTPQSPTPQSSAPQSMGPQSPAPDWPTAAPVDGAHVVVRGDCLWHIASDRLLVEHGRTPTDGEVAAATRAWWQANAEVIGPDPDLLLPGQVLSPPDPA